MKELDKYGIFTGCLSEACLLHFEPIRLFASAVIHAIVFQQEFTCKAASCLAQRYIDMHMHIVYNITLVCIYYIYKRMQSSSYPVLSSQQITGLEETLFQMYRVHQSSFYSYSEGNYMQSIERIAQIFSNDLEFPHSMNLYCFRQWALIVEHSKA